MMITQVQNPEDILLVTIQSFLSSLCTRYGDLYPLWHDLRDDQYNVTKEMRRATFSKLCGRKRDVRTLCKYGSDGSSAEKTT
jgi:hypothetical protein